VRKVAQGVPYREKEKERGKEKKRASGGFSS
jgi:hypothetical protein